MPATSSLKCQGARGSGVAVAIERPHDGQLPSAFMDVGVQNRLQTSQNGTERG